VRATRRANAGPASSQTRGAFGRTISRPRVPPGTATEFGSTNDWAQRAQYRGIRVRRTTTKKAASGSCQRSGTKRLGCRNYRRDQRQACPSPEGFGVSNRRRHVSSSTPATRGYTSSSRSRKSRGGGQRPAVAVVAARRQGHSSRRNVWRTEKRRLEPVAVADRDADGTPERRVFASTIT